MIALALSGCPYGNVRFVDGPAAADYSIRFVGPAAASCRIRWVNIAPGPGQWREVFGIADFTVYETTGIADFTVHGSY